ncbi:MAG: hypothetical protein WC299_07605 [Kiritimatiellia bacterium]
MKYKGAAGMAVAAIMAAGIFEAQAQWVFIARRALGRIEQMSQSDTPETRDRPRYDVATVVVEGHADKVYETALKAIEKEPRLRITRRIPAQRTIEFTDGDISAGMKISQVNETVVHIMIASVVMPGEPSGTSRVVNGVARVCKEMGVPYTIEK